jgi:hypothetical protein
VKALGKAFPSKCMSSLKYLEGKHNIFPDKPNRMKVATALIMEGKHNLFLFALMPKGVATAFKFGK